MSQITNLSEKHILLVAIATWTSMIGSLDKLSKILMRYKIKMIKQLHRKIERCIYTFKWRTREIFFLIYIFFLVGNDLLNLQHHGKLSYVKFSDENMCMKAILAKRLFNNTYKFKIPDFSNTHKRYIPIQKERNVRCHVAYGSQAPIVLTTATLPRWDGDASYHHGNGGELDSSSTKVEMALFRNNYRCSLITNC